MDAFRAETGIAAPLPAANIDTDVIMPKQFLKGINRDGLELGLFHHLRFDETGTERPEFVLNRPGYRQSRFLVVGPNFGCGSSREHAVWGLRQFGVRALIGNSFGSIFYDNCFQNGLLPIGLPETDLAGLMALVQGGVPLTLTVDLDARRISGDWGALPFAVDDLRRDHLLRGLDSIGASLEFANDIRHFEIAWTATHPWFGVRPTPSEEPAGACGQRG